VHYFIENKSIDHTRQIITYYHRLQISYDIARTIDENSHKRNSNAVDTNVKQDPTGGTAGSKTDLESPNFNSDKEAMKENLDRNNSADSLCTPKNSPKDQVIDKEDFLGVTDQIYNTLTTSQQSLLLGQFCSDQDNGTGDDSQYSEWLESMSIDDAAPTPLESPKLDDMDCVLENSSPEN
jgi:hypothetical protein